MSNGRGGQGSQGLVPVIEDWEMCERRVGAAPTGFQMLHRSVVVKMEPS